MTKFSTHVSLDETTRAPLIEILNKALASTIDLQLQVKQAHWNIRGANFFARHELFDDLAAHLSDAADDIAERAGSLGGYAQGTARLSVSNSILSEYDLEAVQGRQHLEKLTMQYGKYAGFLRECIAEGEKDPATEDLFVEVLRTTELDLWFLESHLVG